jgi:hypothetical protein
VFALLGISAGSYVVSKGIQTARDTRMQEIGPATSTQTTSDIHVKQVETDGVQPAVSP